MIKCSLKEIDEYIQMSSKKKRFGRYHQSNFWDVAGYGSKNWIVGVYIDADEEDLKDLEVDSALERCVEYLNLPTPRKKYQKKKPTPPYGFLKSYKGKFVVKDGRRMISALLITSQKKNKKFWGEGLNVQYRKTN